MTDPGDSHQLIFGRFQLDLAKRELRRDGASVKLGSRALDILCVLAQAEGKVVSKNELMAEIWPGIVVEESNIQVHVSNLRKALDEGTDGQSFVVTVPGRGYRFLGLQSRPQAEQPATQSDLPLTFLRYPENGAVASYFAVIAQCARQCRFDK